MEIRSDIICKGNIWNEIQKEYVHKFFDTMWGVFLTCVSIGIMYDSQVDDDVEIDDEDNKVSIPRTMFNRNANEMQFYFQTAILTSNCVNLSETDRLYLAFSENITADELTEEERNIMSRGVSEEALQFDKVSFLKKFANYGASKMHDMISNNDTETMENLMIFLEESYKGETDELKKMAEYSNEDDLFAE